MSNIQWWPAEYLDEMMPEGRASPSDWIIPHGDFYAIAPAGDNLENSFGRPMPLLDGGIVEFISCETICSATLSLDEDGSWAIAPPMPPDAHECCVMGGWQHFTMASNYEDMMELFLEDEPEPDDAYEVSCFTWQPGVKLRFEAATKSFTEIGSLQ